MALRRRWWSLVAALLVAGAGCVDLTQPSGRAGIADAAVDRPVDAMAPAPDAAAMNPEDDPRSDAGTTPDAATPDGASVDASASGDGGGASDASDAAAAASCMELFRDDFESGGLPGWDKTYTSAPAVTSTGAIAGTRSLRTPLGGENAAGHTFASRPGVAVQFTVDLASMTTSGSIPNLAALRGGGLDYNPIAVYFGHDVDGPVVSVRANLSASTYERISYAPLPATRVTMRIEWHAGGVARVFVNGAPFWTSPPLANAGVRVDELRLGNTGSTGSGHVVFDDVVLESCE